MIDLFKQKGRDQLCLTARSRPFLWRVARSSCAVEDGPLKPTVFLGDF